MLTICNIEIPDSGASIILTQSGRFGGWSFYLKDAKPEPTYNYIGLESYFITTKNALPKVVTSLGFDFIYDAGGIGYGPEKTTFTGKTHFVLIEVK